MLIKFLQAAGLEKLFGALRKTMANLSCFFLPAYGGNSLIGQCRSLSFNSTTAYVNQRAIFCFELHMQTFNPSFLLFLDLNSVHPHVFAHHASSFLEMPALCLEGLNGLRKSWKSWITYIVKMGLPLE